VSARKHHNVARKMKVSVIIVTRNRADMLKNCLNSLVRQTKKLDEVIIVDNNSDDHTKDLVNNFNKKLPIKYIFEPRIGTPIARNTGIKNARYDIIAFIDDDCVADENWIKEIKRLNKIYSSNFIFQGISLNPYKNNLFAETTKLLEEFCYFKNKNKHIKNLDSRNISLDKRIFKKLEQYFDVSFSKFNCGEDTDLGFKLQLEGCKILYVPKIVVTHFYITNITSFVKQQFNRGRGSCFINSKWKKHSFFITKSFENPFIFMGSALIMPFFYTYKTILEKGLKGVLYLPFFILHKLSFSIGYMYEKQKKYQKEN